MQNRKIEFNVKNISFYLVGFFLLGLGVNFLKRTTIGAGSWDTVTINLNALIPSLTLGTCSLIVSLTIMAIVLLYRKQIRFLFMVVPLILMALSIDFWDILIFGSIAPTSFIGNLLWFFAGVIVIPFSLALVITSNFPATVFDEMMIMIMHLFKTERVVYVRLGIELFGIVLGTILGFTAGVGFGAVGVGSVLLAFVFSPILGIHLKLLKKVS